ncbi:MAG: M20 family metallopeptidase, partial [Acidobacteria bacterium]|nr:M20 family metallopeptidase [Acidobacteriota bacterium]
MNDPFPFNAPGLAIEGAVGLNAVQGWLDSQRAGLLDFCYRLIETPSPNPPGDERAVMAVICEELSRLKLTGHEIIASDPCRPNLLLWLRGKQAGPLLLYNAHVDTKPVGDQRDRWETDPLRATVKEGRIYGLGAADMKGAVAAFVYALAALKENTTLQGTVCLALTADEEAGSRFGAGYLVSRGKIKADMALIGEPSGIEREWEFLHLGHRGSSCFKVKVHGTQGHSSISNLI